MDYPVSRMTPNTPAHDDRLAAWRLILESRALLTDLLGEELERERGLSLTWYDALLHLNEAPDRRLAMNELAERVVISRSGLTRVVDGLEEAGLVRREPSHTDRRVTQVALTPEGRETLRQAWPVHRRGIEAHFSGYVGQKEARTIVAALTRVVAAARQGPSSG